MDAAPEPLPPIFTAHLYPKIESKLLELLRSLAPEDWEKPTIAPRWNVKSVVAHMLDTQLRGLAASRRRHEPENRLAISDADLLAFIDNLNAEGVRRYGQLDPADLIARMDVASSDCALYHQALDPFGAAMFPVSWAGEQKSFNWFNTAREFTERWHHQQQIRLAVNKPGIMTREFYLPVLDCFMRALPHTYRRIHDEDGVFAQFDVSGDCGGSWFLYRRHRTWNLSASATGKKISQTTIPQEIAWRIFTKGMPPDEARALTKVDGNAEIGLQILRMISVVG